MERGNWKSKMLTYIWVSELIPATLYYIPQKSSLPFIMSLNRHGCKLEAYDCCVVILFLSMLYLLLGSVSPHLFPCRWWPLCPLTLCGSGNDQCITAAPGDDMVTETVPVFPAGPLPPRFPVPSVTTVPGRIRTWDHLLPIKVHLNRPQKPPIHTYLPPCWIWRPPYSRQQPLVGRWWGWKATWSSPPAAMLRKFFVGITNTDVFFLQPELSKIWT